MAKLKNKHNAIKLIKQSREGYIVTTEDGVQVNGSIIDILTIYSCLSKQILEIIGGNKDTLFKLIELGTLDEKEIESKVSEILEEMYQSFEKYFKNIKEKEKVEKEK